MGSSNIIDHIFVTEGIIDYVTASGYMAFQEGCLSDHIMLWIEFDSRKFFGGRGPKIVRPAARDFKYNNTVLREKFITELRGKFEHQNIGKRVHKVAEELSSQRDHHVAIKQYMAIDRDIISSIKGAAKRTVKKNHGYSRSPALSNNSTEVLFWRMILQCKRNKFPLSDRVYTIASRLNIPHDKFVTLTIPKIHSKISKARQIQRQTQDHAKELRIQWLAGAARTKAAEDNDKAEREIQNMIKQMHIVSMHQKLTRITKGSRGGLDYIEVPTGEWYYSTEHNELYHFDHGLFECHVAKKEENSFHSHSSLKVPPSKLVEVTVEKEDDGIAIVGTYIGPIQWRKVVDSEEMESILLERNKKHLQQVAMEEAPPTQPEFRTLFDDYGCGPNSDRVLEGEVTSDLEQFPTVVRTWFQTLKRTEKEKQCHPIDGWITAKEFREAFWKVKENTSSSPSGIHYTFWKCIADDDEISEIMAIMMSLPFVYGFVNERWTYSIDVMLEKVKGLRQIHRLRIIGLVEADFNTALKIFFAKKLIANTESTDLTEEQWARPNRTAMDPALRKLLSFEYSRVMYVTLVFFANDTTACFDRMVPDISAIISRKYGMEKNVLIYRNKVLEELKRSIRTMQGDSKKYYKREHYELPMAGEYQGKLMLPHFGAQSLIHFYAHTNN
jgi:hypothetical protein